ncbi:MAG: cytochrome c biogenesis protein CcsA, partial [Muribaculaceae bacterium]|nr:cytochrome c biogenesis protein CcsA [Muribaculaceae bacterium]
IASASLPMTNGYETMQWMALASCMLGIVLYRRDYITPLCCVVAALAMLVAMMGHRSPEIGVVMPVLRSPLLSVHVLAVMIAYAMFAVMAMCGLAWMCGRRRLLAVARHMIEPAVFFLAAGIFIGAIWANRSWGRYWGWDPKEVWALVTMIVYSFGLHGRSIAVFRRDNFFAVYVVLAFLAVVMTYFGVNYVLGGLHSYA